MDLRQEQINRAVLLLGSGDVVAIPTETVYGLAAAINSKQGIENIFKLKERPFFDPLIVHISDLKQLTSFTKNVSKKELEFATAFWPGPLTIILEKADSLNPMICSGLDTVGVRMPAHPVAREIISKLDIPLAAPSANKFGKTSPTQSKHVHAEWPVNELLVVEGGESNIGIESTVVALKEGSSGYTLEIFRPGFITAEDMEKLAIWDKPLKIIYVESEKSPGHLPYHYQPKKPVVIIESDSNVLDQADLATISQKLEIDVQKYAILDLGLEAATAARELYTNLRLLSEQDIDIIIVFRSSKNSKGLWNSIWDRLNRASSLKINSIV